MKFKIQREYFSLFIIVLVGGLLRLYKLDYQSLWMDELYSIIPTAPNNSLKSIIEHCKTDQPPAFFILLHYWFKIFPYNELFGRLFSAIIGVIGILAVYFLGKEIKNEKVGLFAAFLTSINYYHLFYSQELRFYSLLFLLSAVSFIFFLRFLRKNNNLDFVLYILSTSSLMYTHYFGLFIPMCQACILIYYLIKTFSRRLLVSGIIAGLLLTILYLPWLPVIFTDTQIKDFWIGQPQSFFPFRFFVEYFGESKYLIGIFIGLLILNFWKLKEGGLPISKIIKASFYMFSLVGILLAVSLFFPRINNNFYFISVKFFFYFIIFFIGLFYIGHKLKSNAEKERIFTILYAWLVLAFLIPYAYSILKVPILITRYTLIVLPAIFIFIALLFDNLEKNLIKAGIIVLISVATFLNFVPEKKYYAKISKTQWREASKKLAEINTDNKYIVLTTVKFWLNYYAGKYERNWIVYDINSYVFEDYLKNQEKLIVFQANIPATTIEQQNFLDKYFFLENKYLFKESSVLVYANKRMIISK